MIEVKKTCNIPGCDGKLVARGLCSKHYCRWKRHGSTEQTRPKDWGMKEKHPLYNSWCWLRRSNNVAKMCQGWYDDFWLFVSEVGERPSKNHFLRPIRNDEKTSKSNSNWVEATRSATTENYKQVRNTYMKEWRENNPDKVKANRLKQYFGISLEIYRGMLEAQGGLCAICREGEKAKNKATNETMALCVDHNHETGEVRGLLCINCNKGIGHLKDDAERVMSAAIYLEKHKKAEEVESEVL